MFLGFDITHVQHDIKVLAEKAANYTNEIAAKLKSGEVIDLAKLIPEGEHLREGAIELCEAALKGCQALKTIGDDAGIKARLQRLGSDIVKLQHASDKHSLSYYITCFEVVFHDIFGAKTNQDA